MINIDFYRLNYLGRPDPGNRRDSRLSLKESRTLSNDKECTDLVGDLKIVVLVDNAVVFTSRGVPTRYPFAADPAILLSVFGYDSLGQGFSIPSFRVRRGSKLDCGMRIYTPAGVGLHLGNIFDLPYDYPEIPWLQQPFPASLWGDNAFVADDERRVPGTPKGSNRQRNYHIQLFKLLVDRWLLPAFEAMPGEVFDSRLIRLAGGTIGEYNIYHAFRYYYSNTHSSTYLGSTSNTVITAAAAEGWLPKNSPFLYTQFPRAGDDHTPEPVPVVGTLGF